MLKRISNIAAILTLPMLLVILGMSVAAQQPQQPQQEATKPVAAATPAALAATPPTISTDDELALTRIQKQIAETQLAMAQAADTYQKGQQQLQQLSNSFQQASDAALDHAKADKKDWQLNYQTLKLVPKSPPAAPAPQPPAQQPAQPKKQ